MIVNIVTEQSSWILRRMAQEALGDLDGQLSQTADPNADINYFMNYATYQPINTKTIAYFTHKEDRHSLQWKKAENSCNAGVYMAEMYKPKTALSKKIFPTGLDVRIDDQRLQVGISGRLYKSGRKGEEDVLKLDRSTKDIVWHFMGSGWKQLELQNEAVYCKWIDDDEATRFYKKIDVVLCPSKLEGGPVSMMEAAKIGTPAISYRVGNWEIWGFNATLVSTYQELQEALHQEIIRKQRRFVLTRLGWKHFHNAHVKLFKQVLNEPTK